MFQEDEEEDNDIGKHRFLLCCILNNLHVLSNIMLPVCAHNHFAQYIVSCIKKKKRQKKISQLWKKKTKQIIYCSLLIVHRLIICLEGEANSWTCGSIRTERLMKNTPILLIKRYKNRTEKNTSISITALLRERCFHWIPSPLPSQLPVNLYDV